MDDLFQTYKTFNIYIFFFQFHSGGVDKTDSNAIRHNSFNSKPKVLYGIVIYDYMAHNNKELTIHAGEKVEVSFFFSELFVRVCSSILFTGYSQSLQPEHFSSFNFS